MSNILKSEAMLSHGNYCIPHCEIIRLYRKKCEGLVETLAPIDIERLQFYCKSLDNILFELTTKYTP